VIRNPEGVSYFMTHKQVEEYLLSMPNAKLDYPFGENTAVYKVQDKMFALVSEKSDPVSISLKCDPLLAETLREKYETVMPGYHLNKKHDCTHRPASLGRDSGSHTSQLRLGS
jgi:predicted DNA-binding protein (MmcQ/YjbR family)